MPAHDALDGSSGSLLSSPPKAPETATPTGGLVDEVDPGSGGTEAAEPIALSSTTTNLPPTTGGSPPSKGLAPTDLMSSMMTMDKDKVEDSLRSRFVRASSPKVQGEDEEGRASSIEERMKE